MKESPQQEHFSTMAEKRPSSSTYPLMYGVRMETEAPVCFLKSSTRSEREKDAPASCSDFRRGGYFHYLLEPSARPEDAFEQFCCSQGAQEHCGTGRKRNRVDRSVCRGVGLV